MGCITYGVDEHPFATYFDVHQQYILTRSHVSSDKLAKFGVAKSLSLFLAGCELTQILDGNWETTSKPGPELAGAMSKLGAKSFGSPFTSGTLGSTMIQKRSGHIFDFVLKNAASHHNLVEMFIIHFVAGQGPQSTPGTKRVYPKKIN